ncbi:MAG: GspH/FimT family pseudopilin [Betaproteobacteria bacterium]|nr:MAG: GspH/FimT family pseudopilin [Betaproteobacteria bacterium]
MTPQTLAFHAGRVSHSPEGNESRFLRRRRGVIATLATPSGRDANLLRPSRTNSRVAPGRRRGFTLIEMLVVLMIIGLFFGLVSAITRPDERAMLRLEAERLSQLLDFAAAEARLTGRSIAWTADESGYRFWRADEDASWLEIRDSELLRARTLPQGVLVSGFRVENMRPQGAIRLEFAPQGSLLAFTIGMSLGDEQYSVVGSPIGEVRVVPGKGRIDGEVALR